MKTLYEIFKILRNQKRIVAAATIWGNAVVKECRLSIIKESKYKKKVWNPAVVLLYLWTSLKNAEAWGKARKSHFFHDLLLKASRCCFLKRKHSFIFVPLNWLRKWNAVFLTNLNPFPMLSDWWHTLGLLKGLSSRF